MKKKKSDGGSDREMEVEDKRDGRQGQIPRGSRKGEQAKTSINSTPPTPHTRTNTLSILPHTHNHISNGGRTGRLRGGGATPLTLLKGFLTAPL